ncbi:hypothetical protein SAMN04487948_102341 [Halogranum amylolyticum]|uniref:Uncharacterized protein n=1 Tax=Halogranum amylolyticum TaxID=660520 RepID=A0A1H8PK05_9EURY|nr:hypothetical protein SAMN04487948_102341 [Halogranum amylolyticum]
MLPTWTVPVRRGRPTRRRRRTPRSPPRSALAPTSAPGRQTDSGPVSASTSAGRRRGARRRCHRGRRTRQLSSSASTPTRRWRSTSRTVPSVSRSAQASGPPGACSTRRSRASPPGSQLRPSPATGMRRPTSGTSRSAASTCASRSERTVAPPTGAGDAPVRPRRVARRARRRRRRRDGTAGPERTALVRDDGRRRHRDSWRAVDRRRRRQRRRAVGGVGRRTGLRRGCCVGTADDADDVGAGGRQRLSSRLTAMVGDAVDEGDSR